MTATDVVRRLDHVFGQAIENDEDIYGGNAVDEIVGPYRLAKEPLEEKRELPVDDICNRLLDSEEHACNSAIPPVAEDAVEIIRTLSAECGRLEEQVRDSISHRDAAAQFMQELLDSVETLTGIADQYGARTLADLMYLHGAIANGGFIDYYPDESCVLDVIKPLPSGGQWVQYVKVEYQGSADENASASTAETDPAPCQYRVGVDRTGFRSCTIFVLATSSDEAKKKALEQAGDHDFAGEYDAEYNVSFVEADSTDVGQVR